MEPITFSAGLDTNDPLNQLKLNSIVEDGIRSPGEYENNFDWGYANWSYTIAGDMIYMVLKVRALGWISFGWGGYTYAPMRDSDVVTGYVDDNGVPFVDDYWSTRNPGPLVLAVPDYDAQQDIYSYNGTQDATTTTIEWSRKLNTGDTAQDYEIVPGVRTMVMIGWHETVDNPGWKHTGWTWWFSYWYGNPSPPRNLQAIPSESKVDLTWDIPSGDGNSTAWDVDPDIYFSNFKIYRSFNDEPYQLLTTIENTTITSYTDLDILNAENYKYKVTASNAAIGVQESGFSNEVSVIPMGPLLNPSALTVYDNSFNNTLTWDYPASDGGIPVTKFKIYRSMNITGDYNLIGLNTSSLSYNDYDVINGYTYYYYVLAEHDFLTSNASSTVTANPIGASTPPRDIISEYTDNQVSLSWTEPLSDSGFSITQYRIYRSGTVDGIYDYIDNTISTVYTDNTAKNGKTYYYKITAVNSLDESNPSDIQKITLAIVPSTPGNLNIVSGSSKNSLIWEASDPKGYTILFYTIYRSDGLYNPFVPIATVNALKYDDINVTNSKTYYYLVTANNTIGESSYSNIEIGTPASVPTIPLNMRIKMISNGIKVFWDQPISNGGYFISDYTIERKIDNGIFIEYATSQSKEFMDSNFNLGLNHRSRVSANHMIGSSDYSAVISLIPATNPKEPENLVAVLEMEYIKLTWDIPNNRGLPITSYNIYRSPRTNNNYQLVGVSRNNEYFDSTNSSEIYYYRVSAVNEIGESNYSKEVSIIAGAISSPPFELVALSGNNKSVLMWSIPENDGGLVIQHYNIYISQSNDTGYELLNTSESLIYTVSELQNNRTYYFYVTAVNELGESEKSNIVSVIPQEGHVDPSLIFNSTGIELGNNTNISQLDIDQITQTMLTMFGIGGVGALIFAIRIIIQKKYRG